MWGNDLRQSGVLVALRGVTGASSDVFSISSVKTMLINVITVNIQFLV